MAVFKKVNSRGTGLSYEFEDGRAIGVWSIIDEDGKDGWSIIATDDEGDELRFYLSSEATEKLFDMIIAISDREGL